MLYICDRSTPDLNKDDELINNLSSPSNSLINGNIFLTELLLFVLD